MAEKEEKGQKESKEESEDEITLWRQTPHVDRMPETQTDEQPDRQTNG